MAKKISKKNFKGITLGIYDLELDFLEQQDRQTLGEFSITVADFRQDFTFKQKVTDIEQISNPNIVEKILIDKKAIKIADKFSEIDDPIFDFDDAIELNLAQKQKDSKKIKNIVTRVKLTPKSANKKRY
jgi:hypothetical protein